MYPFQDFPSLQKQKSGQKPCAKCGQSYNNRVVPEYCTNLNCGAYIGGKYKEKGKPMDAMLLTSSIVSVRQNVTGRPIRVFVDLRSSKVCLNNYNHVLRKNSIYTSIP